MIYNYRFDRDLLPDILQRLRSQGVLSQGWGGGVEQNLDIRNKEFVAQCAWYDELASTRIPTNLTRMRDLKRGDLLVVPHLPEQGKVSIHVVADDFPACYEYVSGDKTHQNHRIKIERSYGLDGNVSIHNLGLAHWCGKLPWFRLPIFPIPQFEAEFQYVIGQLEKTPGRSLEASKLSDYIEHLRQGVMEHLRLDLQQIRASIAEISFEAICEQLLHSAGYRVTARNQDHSAGGDVDLRLCARTLRHLAFRDRPDTSFRSSEEAHRDNRRAVRRAGPQDDGAEPVS